MKLLDFLDDDDQNELISVLKVSEFFTETNAGSVKGMLTMAGLDRFHYMVNDPGTPAFFKAFYGELSTKTYRGRLMMVPFLNYMKSHDERRFESDAEDVYKRMLEKLGRDTDGGRRGPVPAPATRQAAGRAELQKADRELEQDFEFNRRYTIDVDALVGFDLQDQIGEFQRKLGYSGLYSFTIGKRSRPLNGSLSG